MPNRRDFCKTAAALMAGMFFQAPAPKRREVMIGNRRVKVIDVHGHFVIPEELDVVKGTNLASNVNTTGPLIMDVDRMCD